MKSAEQEEKSKLCKQASECNEKFAIKNINLLICGSYLITIVIALALTAYVEYRSQKIQINFEKYLENELLKHKEYNNRINVERLHG